MDCKAEVRANRAAVCLVLQVLSEFSQKAFDANAIDSKRRTRCETKESARIRCTQSIGSHNLKESAWQVLVLSSFVLV